MNKFLGVVDSDSILYRIANSCKEEPIEIALNTLEAYIYTSIYKPTECKQYIFCLSGGESGRDEVAVTKPYKGQRPDDRPAHLSALKQHLTNKYNALTLDDYEADDLVIAICDIYNPDCVLIGIDKDAKQFSGTHYNFAKEELFEISYKEAQEHFFTQMLTGDTVDNIPGLPKVGKVKAEKLFKGNPDTPPAYLARQLYIDMGMDDNYWLEQFKLLRMKKDIYYDWNKNFFSFSESYLEYLKQSGEVLDFD